MALRAAAQLFPEWAPAGEVIVINKTEGTGEPKIDMRLYLGELGSAKPGALTPDRPKAPIRANRTVRSPAVSFAWARPLRASSNTVPFATEQACDV